MERRNWSLEALKHLQYIDSLDQEELKAQSLAEWVKKYLSNDHKIEDFDLELSALENLEELFFKNIKFLKKHTQDIKKELDNQKKIKKFLE
jgi:predicted glycosyltransferase